MVAIASALLASGCGDDGGGDAGSPAVATGNAQSSAVALRAELTSRLTDDVYLSGIAVSEAVRSGPAQAQLTAAVAAAKASAAAFARTAGSADGSDAQGELADVGRRQVDALADYAKAKLANQEAGVQEALATLDTLRTEQAATLSQTIGKLDRTKLAEDLRLQIQALVGATDAIVAKEPDAYAELGEAAARAPVVAERLTDAIVADKSDRFAGEPDGPAAAIRANLTARLVADSYLTLLNANAIVRFGGDADTTARTAKATDENAVALSQLLSSVYGEDGGQRTLKLWRVQARLVTGYSRAKVRKDDIAARTALSQLEMWNGDLAELLASLNPRLAKDRVADALQTLGDARTGAIRADAAHSEKTYARQQESAAASAGFAALLARGISAQYPDKFGDR
jgi:hypothetical protein